MAEWTRGRIGLTVIGALAIVALIASGFVLVAREGVPAQSVASSFVPTPGRHSPGTKPIAPDERRDVPGVWTVEGPSVEASPASVVADAAPDADENTRLRVVTVVNRDGVPVVVVDRTRGPQAAAQVVRRRQEDHTTVAVSVDTRVTVGSARAGRTLSFADTLRSSQWALDRLTAEAAWADYSTGAGSVVAVIDTGVDGTHPDLAGQLTNAGADYVSGSGSGRTDPHGHGTHVAGIVAAVRDNGVGIAGLAPSSKVMPIRVLDANGSGWSSDTAKGIIYAADNGADVVNLSLGGPTQDSPTQTAINYALSKGVVVVAAAGNVRAVDNATSYPAAYPGVLAVASTERNDTSSTFSNTGDYIDIAAPGGGILSTVPGGYSYLSGTSMATPYVAATAALVTEITGGTLTTEQFAGLLTSSAWDLGPVGWDQEFGYGLANPHRTLCSFTSCAATTSPSPTATATSSPTPTSSPTTSSAPAPTASVSSPTSTPSSSTPAPSPTETISPTASPTSAEPSPSPSPSDPTTSEKRSVRLGFTTSGGTVRRGGRVLIGLRVTDADTGQPLSGQRVVVRGWRNGVIRLTERTTSDAEGNATVRVRLRRSTRFDLRTPATGSTRAATSPTRILWRIR